ncbi:hypothetical protein HC752_13990 [Vibrio sp. S9_S30]|uniref:hypothetical protein n=1 Tax=Vibrio sp. S9_S30 TaxID=2720226 RepID=UPI001680399A|nr:hypothetical protein [Vibrio sp. S9_S30]MBD1558046.1 hypothetical protein [Vibrio sp. S9_S30]
MMIWLQSNDKYDELAKYDHDSGRFTIASRNDLGGNTPSSTEGIYAIMSTVFVALYKFGQGLFFRIGEQCFPLTDDVIVTVSGEDFNKRQLIVKKAGKEIAHFNYVLDSSKKFSGDPTPFVQNEDFDFGLFVSNISANEKRKRVLLGLD